MNDIVDQRDRKRKEAAKEYTDYRRHAKDRTFEKGDRVIIKQQKKNKLSPLFQPQPYKVIESNHSMVTARSEVDGKNRYQKIYHFTKKSLKQHNFRFSREEEEDDDNKLNDTQPPNHQQIHDDTQPEYQQQHARKQ